MREYEYDWHDRGCLSDLIGKTLASVENKDNYEIIFTVDDGTRYVMYHEQDCCETVYIDDICGDLQDLVGSPILESEEVDGSTPPSNNTDWEDESYTWSFYKMGTIKGSVNIRWYGTSNGYYSESVDFVKIKDKS